MTAAIVFWNAGDIFQFFGDGLTAMDLGRGREIFDQIVLWQLAGILLIAPVISAGAIAEEKERDTLPVLLTTQLGPRLIIREKFYSRMFVVSGLVAMSMPLLGFSYSLGGVSQLQLVGSIVLLLVTVALTIALTMCLSAWCSSTAGALTLSLLLGIPVLGPATAAIAASGLSTSANGVWIPVAVVFCGVVWTFLRLAEAALVARAAVQARNPLLETFRAIDHFFSDLNDRFARGRLIINDRVPLPDDQPVAWRHQYRKSLGTVRYLVRILIALELPVLLLNVLAFSGGHWHPTTDGRSFDIALTLLWLVSSAILLTSVVGLVGAERTHQTLDALLTTPLSTTELLGQYVRGLHRLLLVIAAPFATLLIARLIGEGLASGIVRFVASVAATATLLLTLCWLSLLVSLRSHSQLKATVAVSLLLAAWVALPLAFVNLPLDDWRGQLASLFSPGLLLRQIESGDTSLLHTLGIATVYSLVIWKLRNACLNNADRWLNRC
jgi:ABC-type transport system involved in multi-copper enzyme maturation permease subunit